MATSRLMHRLKRLETAVMQQRGVPALTLEEQIRRRDAADKLLPFVQYTFPRYQADPAHRLLAETLDQVVQGSIRRLMIFAPPQHGKSQLASVHLPAFWLGRRPEDPVILCSYAASLAQSKSRQARQIVEGTEYREVFSGISTRRDSRAVDHWQLANHRGGMLAAGVGGPITGHGAQLGIIDDPLENWEQAQSTTIREKIWEWYRTTFRTRVWEDGAVVLIMTRWHEDDLAGRLLQDQGDRWSVLRLPALAETQQDRDTNNARLGLMLGQPEPLGRAAEEPLCPSRFSRDALIQLRRDIGTLAWAGQYQGVPRAAEGNRFKRQWFHVVDKTPPVQRFVRYWDKAALQDKGCYTVGLLMGWADDLFYVLDVVRGQWSANERNQIMKATAERDALEHDNSVHVWIEQEPGSGGLESAQMTVRLLAGFPIHVEKVTGSKEVRAEPFAAQCEAGNVRLLRASWNAEYIDELTSFPNGRFDDQVDASSGAFNKLTLGFTWGYLGEGVLNSQLDTVLPQVQSREVYQVGGHEVVFDDD